MNTGVFLFLFWSSEDGHHLLIAPESPVLEIGTNFVATCMIMNTTEVTADDLYWTLKNVPVPREQYTKINGSALSVTLNITGVDSEWLLCHMKKDLPYVLMNTGIFSHGIYLKKGCKFVFFVFLNFVHSFNYLSDTILTKIMR